MANEVKTRGEMDPRWQWRLDHIFATEEAFEQCMAEVKEQTETQVKRWKGRVAEDPKAVLRMMTEINVKAGRLMAYARMHKDEDSGDPARQARAARVESLLVELESAGAFINPELLAMPEEELRKLQSDPDFADYSETVRRLILRKPHTLSVEMEGLLAAMGEALNAPGDIFDMFNDVDLPLPQVTMEDGTKGQLTHGNYGPLIRSQNRAVRQEAFEGMHGTFGKFASTLSATYAGNVKACVAISRARHYGSARQASLSPLEIPESVYDNLLSEVENALPALTEYMKVRKKKLGVSELHLYDLYVPIISDFDMKMSYPEAFEMVCEGLAVLGDDYIKTLRAGYAGGWIDVYENKA